MDFACNRALFSYVSREERALGESNNVEAILKVGVCQHSITSHSSLLLEISEEGGLGPISNFDAF